MTENRHLISFSQVNNYNTCSLWEVMGMVFVHFHYFEALNYVFQDQFFSGHHIYNISKTDHNWDLAAQMF